jgi:hypothetical protein
MSSASRSMRPNASSSTATSSPRHRQRPPVFMVVNRAEDASRLEGLRPPTCSCASWNAILPCGYASARPSGRELLCSRRGRGDRVPHARAGRTPGGMKRLVGLRVGTFVRSGERGLGTGACWERRPRPNFASPGWSCPGGEHGPSFPVLEVPVSSTGASPGRRSRCLCCDCRPRLFLGAGRVSLLVRVPQPGQERPRLRIPAARAARGRGGGRLGVRDRLGRRGARCRVLTRVGVLGTTRGPSPQGNEREEDDQHTDIDHDERTCASRGLRASPWRAGVWPAIPTGWRPLARTGSLLPTVSEGGTVWLSLLNRRRYWLGASQGRRGNEWR